MAARELPAEGSASNRDRSETKLPWAQISFADPDSWVENEEYNESIASKEGAHLTYLRWSRQTDAEAGKSFHATAVRLETAVAVQNESQWRLTLEPQYQELTLHWLRIVRGAQRIDHLRPEHIRLLQRETQLEHHIIDGSWTLLVVLNDVRPGDVIESAYSYTSRHPITFGQCEMFFAVPARFVVGHYRTSVLFDSGRPDVAWKTSTDAPPRSERTVAGGRTIWAWSGTQPNVRDFEPNVPSSCLDYTWIQVSDLVGWKKLSQRVAAAWLDAVKGTDLAQVPEFASPEVIDAAAVHRLVRRVQDEFRYLSIDLDAGGWVPANPVEVARQRFGDCKDLVSLAVAVLRRWGVKARAILVGTGLREAVASLLPASLLFNHAVLEVEWVGEKRWFDLTLRQQGGDFTSQPVGWFGHGLPVDENADSLEAQPGVPACSIYSLRETIFLDSRRGEPSVVEQRLWVEGFQAESLRRSRLQQGAEGFAQERLQQAQHRYGKASRMSSLQWRDNRDKNVCEVIETFEIREMVYAGEGGARAIYDVPRNMVAQAFTVPEEKVRRSPWNMPYPLDVRHLITVNAQSMGASAGRMQRWDGPEYTATLDEPRPAGAWTKTARFIVCTPEIGADRVADFRQNLADFFQATSWRIYLPWGRARSSPEKDFGALPSPERGIAAYVPPDDPQRYPKAVLGASSVVVDANSGWRGVFARTKTPRMIFIGVWILAIIVAATDRGCTG